MNVALNEINELLENIEATKEFKRGLSEAVKIISKHLIDDMQIGNEYWVITYDNNKNFPKVEKMRLFYIFYGEKVNTYCFTRRLETTLIRPSMADIKFKSEKEILRRVFYTEKQALAKIKLSKKDVVV